MAHYAKIDENNIVEKVLVVSDDKNADWLNEKFGGVWIQTSYNTYAGEHKLGGTPLRKNFASKGDTYDSELDAFIPPKPFDSWLLDKETCLWNPPKPAPEIEGAWEWDEEKLDWTLSSE